MPDDSLPAGAALCRGAASAVRTPWLTRVRCPPAASCRLFCFPYAGGSAGIYANWSRLLGPEIEVCAIRLPGRAERLREPPFTRMEPLVDALASAMAQCSDRPCAFFGHSMGAMVSFEVARTLRARGERQPSHLLLSACAAPTATRRRRPCHQLSDDALVEELRRLNGTPAEALATPEILDCLLPAIRADFEVMETYCYRPAPPLDVPITVIGGTQDPDVSPEELAAWGVESTVGYSLRMLAGDHFFLHSAEQPLAGIVRALLAGQPR